MQIYLFNPSRSNSKFLFIKLCLPNEWMDVKTENNCHTSEGKIKGRHKQKLNAHLEMKSLVSGNVEFSSRRDIR